jgi:hypothetical protein
MSIVVESKILEYPIFLEPPGHYEYEYDTGLDSGDYVYS